MLVMVADWRHVRSSVLIIFMRLNPLSHSAVATGMVRRRSTSMRTFGRSFLSSSPIFLFFPSGISTPFMYFHIFVYTSLPVATDVDEPDGNGVTRDPLTTLAATPCESVKPLIQIGLIMASLVGSRKTNKFYFQMIIVMSK